MNIGNNIKNIRNQNHLTQKQLAEIIEVSTVTIQNYENNRREPNIQTLNKISTALEVSVSTLLWDEGKFIKDLISYFQEAYQNSTNHFPKEDEIINILINNSIITTLVAELIMADYNNLTIKEIENLISFIKKLDQSVYQKFIDNEETQRSRLLGERISAIRNKNNMPLTDLTILTGIKEFLLMKIEKGFMTYPPEDFLKKIATALDVSINVLIGTEKNGIQELIQYSLDTGEISTLEEISDKASLPLERIKYFSIGGDYTPEDFDKIVNIIYGSYADYINSPGKWAQRLGQERAKKLNSLNHLFLALESYYGTKIHEVKGNPSKVKIDLEVNNIHLTYSEKEFEMFLEFVCKNFVSFKSTIEIIKNSMDNDSPNNK